MAPVLTVEELHTHFISKNSVVRAVNGVSFALDRESVLALVGESGAGKTTTSLSIMGLLPSSAKVMEGRVLFDSGPGGGGDPGAPVHLQGERGSHGRGAAGPPGPLPLPVTVFKVTTACRRRLGPPLVEMEPGHWVACYNPVRYG